MVVFANCVALNEQTILERIFIFKYFCKKIYRLKSYHTIIYKNFFIYNYIYNYIFTLIFLWNCYIYTHMNPILYNATQS